jgi:hypothetical protein
VTTHSKIGASGMYRWAACPGSVRLSEGVARTSSKYAEEGTAAHALAETCLTYGHQAASYVGRPVAVNDELDGPMIVVTEEMAEAVQVYLDTVREDTGSPHPDVIRLVEHKFDLSAVHPGLFGTADCVVIYKHSKFMRVFDYKHGAGVAVDPENNPQLMYYALGALLTVDYPITEIEIVIVQPRLENAEPVKRWRLPAADLLDFAADLVKYAKATEAPDAPLVPGEHCKFCPAAAICPALEAKALAMFDAVKPAEETFDPAKLAETLRWLPVFEGWIKSVREFAYAEATRGAKLPGWKLVAKRATRKWIDEGATFVALRGLGLDENEIRTAKLKSPAQVEKLLAPEKRDALEPLVAKESSGNTLAPDTDDRPAAATVADFFS